MKPITLLEFRKLVESCAKEVLVVDAGFAPARGCEEVFSEISSMFASVRIEALHCLEQLRSELIVRFITDDENLDVVFETMSLLIDSIKQEASSLKNVIDPWRESVQLILRNQQLFLSFVEPSRVFPARTIALANHMKTLRGCGYVVEILDGKPSLSTETLMQITTEINVLCKLIGGPTLVYNVLEFISNTYDPVQQRYHLVRQLSTNASNNHASPPWGLLLQLGGRQGLTESESDHIHERMNKLIRLLTAIVGLDGFEPSSVFDMLQQSDLTLIDFLQRAVTYDVLYSLNQIRPADAARICHGVFDEWIELRNATQVKDVLRIADAIWAVSTPQTPFAFKAEQLVNRTGLSAGEIARCSEEILVQAPVGLLTLPLKSDSLDSSKKPLIRLKDGGFCMIEKSICASSFLEAIFLAVRSSGKKFDIGPISEKFLLKVLAEAGVKCTAGYYKLHKSAWDSAQQGECDVVIETKEEILFLELKAKSLTRAAQAGDTHKLVDDLTGSLIDAHCQALKHELRLRTYGQLDFLNGETLVLGERKIERVVVSLSDFGCLHSRSIFHKFLSLSCRGYFESHTQPDRFASVNEKLDEMRVVLSELTKIEALNQRAPFWNSWFLSVPQVLILLDHVTCGEDFVKELLRLRAIVMGSFDFYREYELARSFQ